MSMETVVKAQWVVLRAQVEKESTVTQTGVRLAAAVQEREDYSLLVRCCAAVEGRLALRWWTSRAIRGERQHSRQREQHHVASMTVDWAWTERGQVVSGQQAWQLKTLACVQLKW
jgi:hypothetical protein